MPQLIHGPDGTINQFPDDMSDADITKVMAQHYPAPAASAPVGAPPSTGESFWHGLTKPLVAAYQLYAHQFPDDPQSAFGAPGDTAKDLDRYVSANQQSYDARRAAGGMNGVDWPEVAGNFVSTLPLAMVGGGGLAANAAAGVANGLLQPVTDPNANFATAKLTQAGVGGATGGTMSLAGSALSKIAAPVVDGARKVLMDSGVPLTPGQLIGPRAAALEDKLSSIPVLGGMIKSAQADAVKGFNKSLYNQALAPIGETVDADAGHAGVQEVADKLSKSYQDILPQMTFTADPQFHQDLGAIGQNSLVMTPDKQTQFQAIMANKVIPRLQNGQMDGTTVKNMENELGNSIARFGSSSSADDQILADNLRDVRSAVLSNLQRTNSPELADRLAKTNYGWAIYTRIRDAASRLGQEQQGVFSQAQYLSALRAGDTSVGKGAFAQGTALTQPYAEAAKSVIGSKYPDSGTAGRLGAIAALGGGAKALGLGPWGIGAAIGATLPYTKVGQSAMNAFMSPAPWRQQAAPLLSLMGAPATSGVMALTNGMPSLTSGWTPPTP